MSEEKKLGQEPAFGFEYSTFEGKPPFQERIYHHPKGISKRFYAACAAITGLVVISDPKASVNRIVKDAYRIADELLKQENE